MHTCSEQGFLCECDKTLAESSLQAIFGCLEERSPEISGAEQRYQVTSSFIHDIQSCLLPIQSVGLGMRCENTPMSMCLLYQISAFLATEIMIVRVLRQSILAT